MKAFLLTGLVLLLSACGVQPSGVIVGNPAPAGSTEGIVLYLVRGNKLTLVVRPFQPGLSPAETLTLLAAGPTTDEQYDGITTDVPPGIGNIAVDGNTITLPVDVGGLSATAVDQFACTLAAISDPDPEVTVTGQGRTRGPRKCPV